MNTILKEIISQTDQHPVSLSPKTYVGNLLVIYLGNIWDSKIGSTLVIGPS